MSCTGIIVYMKKNPAKPFLWLFILTTLICAFIFVPYLHGSTAFVLGWDMRTLYSSNFEALRTMMHAFAEKGVMPFWNWASFLGNDYYSSKLFYFQDIFDYPFAFTQMKYRDVILIATYLKFLTASFSFYAYAAYNRYSRRTAILGSLMFAFSAYNLQTMMHPFFGSFFVFLPLYFLAVDRWIRERKPFFYVFMVFFMFINNYYLFYSLSLFTIIYFIWRWQKQYGNLKGMMKEAMILIGYYLVGFILSAAVVLPEVLAILANSRIGSRSSVFVYDSIVPYLDYLTGVLMPGSALANRGTEISSLYSYTSANDSVMAVFLWSSSLTILMVPQLLKRDRQNRLRQILWLIISAVALIPILSSVMHGFSEPSFRWLASPSFLLIISVMPFIEHPEELDIPLLKKELVILPVVIAAVSPLISLISTHDLAFMQNEWYFCVIFIPALILIGYALLTGKRNILLWSLVGELSLVSFLSFYGTPEFTRISKEEDDRLSHLLGESDAYNRFLRELDPDNEHQFFRTYIDPLNVYWGLSTNYNLNHNIMGLLSYDSTYQYSANELRRLDPEHVQHYLPWTFNITNPDIMDLVGTKYALVMDENEVPFTNYEYAGQYLSVSVYRNLDYVNFGKTYTQVISDEEYEPSISAVLHDTVIAHDEDLEVIRSLLGTSVQGFDTAYISGNTVFAEIYTDQPGFAVLQVPYDEGWHVSVNEEPAVTFQVSGGLTGIALRQGYNGIYMSFTPRGLTAGLAVSGAGIILVLILFILKRKRSV